MPVSTSAAAQAGSSSRGVLRSAIVCEEYQFGSSLMLEPERLLLCRLQPTSQLSQTLPGQVFNW
jgi:hypothetical protein